MDSTAPSSRNTTVREQFKTPRDKAWDQLESQIAEICASTDDPVRRKADIKSAAHAETRQEDENGIEVIAQPLGVDLGDKDYEALIAKWELAQEIDVVGIKAGEAYEVSDELFLWDGVVVQGSGTLLVGGAKTGKSSLICSMLGAMNRGEKEHLGRALNYETMPDVFIVGTDQNKKDWNTLLIREGLAWKDESTGQTRNLDCIKEMFTRGDKIYLDQRGIAALARRAAAHPGCLIVLDSYTSLTTVLGHKEISKEWCDAARQLAEALEPLEASWIVLHHTNQGNVGGTTETASRGHTDLPSQFTWNNLLMWTRAVPEGAIRTDHRLTLTPSGRAKAEPMVIQLVDDAEGQAKYITHGDYQFALRSERVRKAEMDLFKAPNSPESLAYLHACSLHEIHGTEMSVKLLCQQFGDKPKVARAKLNRLEDMGLLIRAGSRGAEGGRGGMPAVLWVPAVSDQGQGLLDQRDAALNYLHNIDNNNLYIDKGAKDQKTPITAKNHTKGQEAKVPAQEDQNSQGSQSSLRDRALVFEYDFRGTPVPREGGMVQVLRNGKWENNRVLTGSVDFKDDLSAAVFLKPGMPVVKGLQWMRTVKPCDEAHPANEEPI